MVRQCRAGLTVSMLATVGNCNTKSDMFDITSELLTLSFLMWVECFWISCMWKDEHVKLWRLKPTETWFPEEAKVGKKESRWVTRGESGSETTPRGNRVSFRNLPHWFMLKTHPSKSWWGGGAESYRETGSSEQDVVKSYQPLEGERGSHGVRNTGLLVRFMFMGCQSGNLCTNANNIYLFMYCQLLTL